MTDIAIKIENLSKRYRIGLKDEMQDSLIGKVGSIIKSPFSNFNRLKNLSNFKNGTDEEDVIWALKDVSFEVKRGEVLGVIGANGAGKSTLLKILAQITQPTFGRIELNGRVASLLEVGSGFHPDLTGRENIYLNGTILGMTKKEIDNKFDEIVAFSGVEKFIDTPVKRYSSGMVVRLAFSVAAHLNPDILLIDEVLAVGDADFQEKCIDKMGNISGEGRTVLMVSHRLGVLPNICEKSILISNGKIQEYGNTYDVVRIYRNKSFKPKSGDRSIIGFIDWKIKNNMGNPITMISEMDGFILTLIFSIPKNIELVPSTLRIYILNDSGTAVFDSEYNISLKQKGLNEIDIQYEYSAFSPGIYFIEAEIYGGMKIKKSCHHKKLFIKSKSYIASNSDMNIETKVL